MDPLSSFVSKLVHVSEHHAVKSKEINKLDVIVDQALKDKVLSQESFLKIAKDIEKIDNDEAKAIADKIKQAVGGHFAPEWKKTLQVIKEHIQLSLPNRSLSQGKSILDTQKGKAPSDKAFAHIHAESLIIDDKTLEGNARSVILNDLKNYLDSSKHKESSWYPKVQKMLNDLLFVENYENTFIEAIGDLEGRLQVGEKMFLEAGWTDREGGHAMKMSIEKQPDDQYTIRLYNLGAGVESYHPFFQEEGQSYYQPYIEIVGVSSERLFDTDFLDAFYEQQNWKKTSEDRDTEYGPNDVYGLIIDGLGGKLVPPSVDSEKYMLPQNSGTCSFASYVGMFFTELEKHEFHQLMSDLSFTTLSTYYQSKKNDLANDVAKRLVLQNALIVCARYADSAITAGAIGQDQLQIYYDTLKDAEERLENVEKMANYSQSVKDYSLESARPKEEVAIKFSEKLSPPEIEVKGGGSQIKDVAVKTTPQFDFTWIDDPEKVGGGLKSLTEHFHVVREDNEFAAHAVLEKFFSLLPGKETVWDSIPPQDIENVIVELGNISMLLLTEQHSIKEKPHVYTAYALYLTALQQTLSPRYPGLMLEYSPDINLDSVKSLKYDSNIYSPEVRYLRQKAIEIIEKNRSHASFGGNIPITKDPFIIYEPNRYKGKDIYHDYELSFVADLLNKDDTLLEKLREAYPQYEDELGSREFQMALALCDLEGKFLPPGFCAIRKNISLTKFLLKTPNYSFDGKISFKLEPEKEKRFAYKIVNRNPLYVGPEEREHSEREQITRIRNPQIDTQRYNSESDVMARGYEPQELLLAMGSINGETIYQSGQIFKALAFYSRNFESLTSKDDQVALKYLLFESNYLEEILSQNPEVAKILANFIARGFQIFKDRRDLSTALFFDEIGRYLDNIVKFQLKEELFPDFREELIKLLELDLTLGEKFLVYRHIAESYETHAPNRFTANDASLLLIPKFLGNYSKLNAEPLERYKEPIRDLILGNEGKEICQRVLESFDPGSKRMDWILGYPVSKSSDGRYSINFALYRVKFDGKRLSGLSDSALGTLKANFGGLFSQSDYLCTYLEYGFQFTDERGIETQFDLYDKPIIRQKIDGLWFQIVSLPSDLLVLPSDSYAFASLEKDLPVIDIRDKDYHITHRLHLKGSNITDVRKYETDEHLVLGNTFQPGSMLWEDNKGHLSGLEIPNLGLSFKIKESSPKSQEYPGFFLSPNQDYRGIDRVKGAIVLENKSGKRKLVLPAGAISNRYERTLSTSFEIENIPGERIAFDLDSGLKPEARSPEHKLYLANLLFAQKQYKEAQELIRGSHSNILDYSLKSIELLNNIINTNQNDKSPHATAVILLALSKLQKNDLEQERVIECAELYAGYKQQTGVIPELLVTKEEEQKAIAYLIKYLEKDNQKAQELADSLRSPSDDTDYISVRAPREKTHRRLNLRTLRADIQKEEIKEFVSFPHKTRPEKLFQQQFLTLYSMALDPERHAKLDVILAGVANDKEVPTELLVLLKAARNGFSLDIPSLKELIMDTRLFENHLNEAAESLDKEETLEPLQVQKPPKEDAKPAEPARHLYPKPLKKPAALLPEVLLEEAFDTIPNQGVQLSKEEREELKEVVQDPETCQHIENYWSQSAEDWHQLKLPSVKLNLQISRAEIGKRELALEQELLNFANSLPEDSQEALKIEIGKLAHRSESITLKDLIVFTARSRHFRLTDKNKELAGKEEKLLNACLVYLDCKAQRQQVDRSLHALNEIESAEGSEAFYKEVTRVRPYASHDYPELLVFEAIASIGLYESQVNDLSRILEPKEGENPNVILEKVMGSGKTKVYLPLIALAQADGDHLSFIVVHSSQYQTVAQAMETGSGQMFAQNAHTIQFSRESDTSTRALRAILEKCENVLKNRDFLVVTDKTLHSLSLAFDEMWDEYLASDPPDRSLERRINVMKEILTLFKTKGKATLDEADLLLNTRFETVYAIGEKQPIDSARREVVADIFECLSAFKDKDYETIKPDLIRAFVKKLRMGDAQLIVNYLENGKEGDSYVKTLTQNVQQVLAIARYQFQDLLGMVLAKRCGEHYGNSLNPEKKLPVPFNASGVPSPSSEFAFPYALMDYAILTLEQEGPSAALLGSIIQELQTKARKELDADPRLTLKETEGYKEFLAIAGLEFKHPFFKITPEQILELAKALKADHPNRFEFAKKYLFPEVTIHPRKLTSTSYRMYNMLLQVQGFTGTPYNSDAYPQGLQMLRDVQSAGKTLGIIWKHSQVVKTPSLKGAKTAEEIVAKLPVKDYHAYIDVGADFNGIANIDAAKALLKALPESIKGVLFYHDNLPHVLERDKMDPVPAANCGLKPQKLFNYYDQWHTTGTDHPIGGRSLISINKNNKLRDFEQGYMRDRKAGTAPRIDLLVSEENLSAMRATSPKEIIRALELNQEEEIRDQLLMGAFASIKESLDNHLRTLFLDAEITPRELHEHRKELRKLIGDLVVDDPYSQFGKLQEDIPRETFFEGIIDTTVAKAKPLIALGRISEQDLRKEIEHAFRFHLLPETISSTAANAPDQLLEKQSQKSVQQQRMAMVQKNTEENPESANKRGAIHWNWFVKKNTFSPNYYDDDHPSDLDDMDLPELKKDWNLGLFKPVSEGQVPIFSLKDVFSSYRRFSEYDDIFDLQASYNFMPLVGQTAITDADTEEPEYSIINTPPLSRRQMHVHNMLIKETIETHEIQAILISEADRDFFFEKLAKERESTRPRTFNVTLYNTTLGILQYNGSKAIEESAIRDKIVQAKFFNGESLYTKEELLVLKSWIEEKGVERMKTLFTEHILKYKEDKERDYQNSMLRDLFESMIK